METFYNLANTVQVCWWDVASFISSWAGVMLKLMCKILASWFLTDLKIVGPEIISMWKILQSLTHSVHHFIKI